MINEMKCRHEHVLSDALKIPYALIHMPKFEGTKARCLNRGINVKPGAGP